MENKVELSAGELAALELLILTKNESPQFIHIPAVVQSVVHATPVVIQATQVVAAVVGDARIKYKSLDNGTLVETNATLEDLIKLRNSAIKSKE